MKLSTALASATAPFAHLLGLPAKAEDDKPKKDEEPAAKAEEDEERKRKEGESDEDYEKRMAKLDEEEEEKEKAEAEKAKTEGDDKSDDEEMRGTSAVALARSRERARCKAIFGHPAAGARPDVAANLAFNTKMSRDEAIAVLASTATVAGPRGRTSLDQRMAAVQVPKAGAGSEVPSSDDPKAKSQLTAAAIVAAGKKARGE